MTEQDPTAEPGPRRDGARKQVLLRLDPAVHAAVAKWASDDLRSVNAQIEVILRRALAEAGREARAAPLRRRGRPPKRTDPENADPMGTGPENTDPKSTDPKDTRPESTGPEQ